MRNEAMSFASLTNSVKSTLRLHAHASSRPAPAPRTPTPLLPERVRRVLVETYQDCLAQPRLSLIISIAIAHIFANYDPATEQSAIATGHV